jgi:DNA-binding winged helix-turn-helix (wHTH) protein
LVQQQNQGGDNSAQSYHGEENRSASMTEFPPFRMDVANECLWHRGDGPDERRILLTPKAFAMLRYLVEHAGRLVTQEEMLEALWPETYVQPEVLKSHIRDIRGALGDDAKSPRFIETLPRRGYRFIAPVNDPIPAKAQIANASNGKLVGRDRELRNLTESLRRTLRDQQQIVFVTGEAGIGKTALVEHFQRQALAGIPGIRIACGQCIEGYGGKEAYYPIAGSVGSVVPYPRRRIHYPAALCAGPDVAGAIPDLYETGTSGNPAS